jgi:hypothetical protein
VEATVGLHYSEAFIEQVLFKVYSRGKRSVQYVADELNINSNKIQINFSSLRCLNGHYSRPAPISSEKML